MIQVQHLILSHRRIKAAQGGKTPCSVRNKLVHRGHDQSMKCVLTVFISSAKPFAVWYIDMLIIYIVRRK
jgi:hypothetical protein